MGIMDQAKDFLNSDDFEQKSDDAIKHGQDAINGATGNKFADQVNQSAEFVDEKLGNNAPQNGPGAEQGN